MAFIKTEKDTDKDKQVTGKGVDQIAKELEMMYTEIDNKFKKIETLLGVEKDIKGNYEQENTFCFGGLNFKKYDSGEFSATMSGSGDKWTKQHGLRDVPSLVTVWGQFSGESYWIQLVCQALNDLPLKAHTGHQSDPSNKPQGCSTIKATSTSITFNNDREPEGSVLVGSKGIDDINKCRVVALLFN